LTVLLGALATLLTLPGLVLEGQATQGGLVLGQTQPGAEVALDGNPVRVWRDGTFLIGFGRDAPAAAALRVVLPDETVIDRTLAVSQREFRVQRIDGLPPSRVQPPPEVSERIRREAELVRGARGQTADRADYAGGFSWPLTGRISGVYGSQRILNGEPRQPHYGVDVARPAGTVVSAPAPGTVSLAEPDLYFSGGTLIIDHGRGLSSTFIHLSRILVAVGDRVAAGDPIAEVGATGRATGPHLDWRMNLGDVRLDPALLAGPMPKSGSAGP
jgi:murein DD-endopeptidase MepM/ murein hydrolase activator NlpD